MRILFRGGLALVVCLGLTMLQGLAQNPAVMSDELPTTGIFNDPQWRAWAGKSTAHRMAQQKQAELDREAKEREAKTNPAPTVTLQSLAEARQKDQDNYFRRQEVCDRLMRIALETNDQALMKQVEQLDAEIFQLYERRTGKVVTRRPEAGTPAADEKNLDSKLGPKSSETGMMLPMPPPTNKKPVSVATRQEGKP